MVLSKEEKKAYGKKYYQVNKEELKEYSKKYREEHKEEVKVKLKKWREEHKEENKKYYKKYNQEHQEEIKEYGKKYRQEHQEELKEREKIIRKIYFKTEKGKQLQRRTTHTRRAKINQVIHIWTQEQYNDKLESCHGICKACNEWVGKNKLTLDHYYPMSKAKAGRTYSIEDIGFVCRSCNSKKGSEIQKSLKITEVIHYE